MEHRTGQSGLLERLSTQSLLVSGGAVLALGFVLALSGVLRPAEPLGIGSLDLGTVETGLVAEAPRIEESLSYFSYRVVKGDTISELAARFNVFQDSIISFNQVTSAKSLQIGQYLRIPTINGILHVSRKDDTIDKIALTYKIAADRIREANGLLSAELAVGAALFLPDARLPNHVLHEITGDLFRWPVKGYLSSWYGWRRDPFSGSRIFHNGIDIGARHGTSVFAAMNGTVNQTGYNGNAGNFISIRHSSGYSTYYCHLSAINVSAGQAVSTASRIGSVGNTGYSSGSHLHFTILKNGRTVNPIPLVY